MSSLSELSQVGIVAVVEVLAGGVAGIAVDAAFPDSAPDAPFLVQAAEVLGETAVVGMLLSVMGKYIIRKLNPSNATGGFTFFLGLTSGIANYRVKMEVLMAKLKLRGAGYLNSAMGSVQPPVVEKVVQMAPTAQ